MTGRAKGRVAAAALFLAAFSFTGVALAQLYKWVDERGKTHYSDKPPPKGTKVETLAPPPPAPSATSAPPKGKTLTQFDFSKEEEQALRMVCAIKYLQHRVCRPVVSRPCTLEELLSGVPGRPSYLLTKDPRRDPNYDYKFSGRQANFSVAANARKSGLAGFVATKDATHYNMKGAASAKDPKVQGELTCPDFMAK